MSVLPTDLHALLGYTAADEQLVTFIKESFGNAAEPDSIKVYSGRLFLR